MSFIIGCFLTSCGFFNLGFLEVLFSQTINSAYIAAIALTIIIDQTAKMSIIPLKSSFTFPKLIEYITKIPDINWANLLISLIILIMFFGFQHLKQKKFPNNLFATLHPVMSMALLTFLVTITGIKDKYNIPVSGDIDIK